MNIALGALLLFLLLFPGILLRTAYLNGPYSRKNIQTSLVDELILSLLPSFLLQGLGYLLAEYVFLYQVHLEPLYQVIIGANNPGYRPDFNLIEKSLGPFFGYNLMLMLLAFSAGKLFRLLVEQTHLDILFHSLRYNNDWYYLLTGRVMSEVGWPQKTDSVKYVFVDALVETKEGSVLYCGLLDEFYLSKDGVDRICLSEVYRRSFIDDIKEGERLPDKSLDKRYYKMPGDLFVIPYSQIRNLNLTYYGPVQINRVVATG